MTKGLLTQRKFDPNHQKFLISFDSLIKTIHVSLQDQV